MKKRGWNILFASIGVVLILAASACYVFLYSPQCSDETCFMDSISKCSKSSYINEDETAIWQYRIKYSVGATCNVNVKALAIKTDVESSSALTGKEMLCSIPKNMMGVGKGVPTYPEKQLSYCHGDLKESIQDLMIKRMQLYVINALGK